MEVISTTKDTITLREDKVIQKTELLNEKSFLEEQIQSIQSEIATKQGRIKEINTLLGIK